MCEPTTIMLAVSAVTSAVGAVAEYQQTKSSAAAQETNLQNSMAEQQSALNVQQVQVNEQTAQQVSERAKQALIERGHMIAAGADSGVEGSNQARLINGSQMAEAQDMATLDANRRAAEGQNQLQKRGIVTQTQGALNQIKQPSLVGTGLKIIGAGADFYTAGGLKSKPTSSAGFGMGNRSA
jgi:hypothetical protein